MKKFYMTFGSGDTMPYRNGWVEIIAENLASAQEKFLKRFGEKGMTKYGCINYSFAYTEEEFKKTIMWDDRGNLGYGCHEIIK